MAQHHDTTPLQSFGRLFTVGFACGSLCLLMLVGCDRQAQKIAQMQGVLDQAVATIQEAEVGYVPAQAKPYVTSIQENVNPRTDTATYTVSIDESIGVSDQIVRDDYRQDKLDAAIKDLQAVANSGSNAQKAVALKMLAAIDASSTRHLQRQATQASAKLIGDASADLLELLAVIECTDAAGKVLDQNDSGLIEKVGEELQVVTRQRDEVAASLRELTAQRDTELSREKAQRELASKKVVEAQRYAEKAFVEKGDKHYALLDKEAQAKREAGVASIAADGFQLAGSQLSVKIVQKQQQLEALDASVKALTDKRDGASKRLEATNTSRGLLDADRDKQFQELNSRYVALQRSFAEQVVEVYGRAEERANDAIQRLEEAQKFSSGRSGQEAAEVLKTDELTARLDLAGVLTRKAVATDTMLKVTRMLDDGLKRTGVPADSKIGKALEGIEKQLAEDIKNAQEAISAAQDQGASDQIRAVMTSYREQLPK